MFRTPEQIQKQIAVHEKRIEALRDELKEAENKPKPGDVLVDQHGKVYIAASSLVDDLVLWAIGVPVADRSNQRHVYVGTYNYWKAKGLLLSPVLIAGMESRPFNVLRENG